MPPSKAPHAGAEKLPSAQGSAGIGAPPDRPEQQARARQAGGAAVQRCSGAEKLGYEERSRGGETSARAGVRRGEPAIQESPTT